MSRTRPGQTRRCGQLLDQLMAYLDGDLTPSRCRAIEQHIAQCECCEAMAANLRAVMALCRTDRQPALPPAVRRRAQARVRALLANTSTDVQATTADSAAAGRGTGTVRSKATRRARTGLSR